MKDCDDNSISGPGIRDRREDVLKSGNPSLLSDRHIPALDGVRGLAILLVLFFHLNLLHYLKEVSPIDQVLLKIASAGWYGVDLFFVLSGFLITGILLDTMRGSNYFRNFYFRRTIRIFPLYYLVLFLSFVIIPNLPAGIVPEEKLARLSRVEGDEIWYWLYLSNFSTAAVGEWRHGILDVTWSLAIEEQFYLVWPVLILLLSRKKMLLTCAILFLVAPCLRTVMVLSEVNPIATLVITPARMDLLAMGAFVALALRGPGGVQQLLPLARSAWIVTSGLLVSLFFWRDGFNNMDPIVQTVGFSVLGVNFASLLVLVLASRSDGFIVQFFSTRSMRTIGKYSYAMYLFHMPIRALIRDTVYGPEQFMTLFGSRIPGQLLFYTAATSLTFATAYFSYHLYEKHFLKLKRYVHYD